MRAARRAMAMPGTSLPSRSSARAVTWKGLPGRATWRSAAIISTRSPAAARTWAWPLLRWPAASATFTTMRQRPSLSALKLGRSAWPSASSSSWPLSINSGAGPESSSSQIHFDLGGTTL